MSLNWQGLAYCMECIAHFGVLLCNDKLVYIYIIYNIEMLEYLIDNYLYIIIVVGNRVFQQHK